MPIVAVVGSVAMAMLLVERIKPGRLFPRVSGWWPRAVLLNLCQVGATYLAGVVWDDWMATHRLWSLDALGPVPGAIIGYLVITFVYYWWHRWRHEVDLLWKWIHQAHHSPQRIEVITSFYKHPFEILLNGALSSAIVYLLVGLSPGSAAIAVLMTGLAELIYHWNVQTPHWLGFVFQRPESHCVHHETDHHTQNFGDLPLWDMLFGTFYSPRAWESTCGFGEGEHRLGKMLMGRDVVAS